MPINFTREQIDQIGRIAARVGKLSDRCDAFFERRAQRDAEKAQRRSEKATRRAAKRDSDPVSEAQGAPPDWLDVAPYEAPDWFPENYGDSL